ncbi:hypothetical protein AgCh_001293 [Apium graveolens]
MITSIASPHIKLSEDYDDDDDDDDDKSYGRRAANIFYSESLEDSVILPLVPPFDYVDFVGSCNGIVCVSNAKGTDIFLFNPLTRLSRRLPPHVVPIGSGHHSERPCKCYIGYGFDAVSDEFEVLKIVYRRDNHRLVRLVTVYLYSSNADLWREIELGVELPSMVCYPLCPILRRGPVVDGILYLEGIDVIVTFDLHSELFGVVPFPSFMQTRKSNVFDFEGSVSVLVESVLGDGSLDKEISLWTMETVSGNIVIVSDKERKLCFLAALQDSQKRRERINEKLRTLQNLVPNGTKVDIGTMLEDAVQYVKFLQLQIKLLSSDKWMYAPIAYNGTDLRLDSNIAPPLYSA